LFAVIVQAALKKTKLAALRKIRKRIAGVHSIYLRRFAELLAIAEEEKEQERARGGPR
jgi:hypothetical protein